MGGQGKNVGGMKVEKSYLMFSAKGLAMRSKMAFTLIELLVVIAIIALLIALLLTPLVLFAQTTSPPAQPAKPTASPQQRAQSGPEGPTQPAMPGAPPQQVPPPGPPMPNGGSPQTQMAQQAAAVEEDPDWAVTLERIASSVVSIEVNLLLRVVPRPLTAAMIPSAMPAA